MILIHNYMRRAKLAGNYNNKPRLDSQEIIIQFFFSYKQVFFFPKLCMPLEK